MGSVQQRDTKARRKIILAAGKRWQNHQGKREDGLLRIAREGPGTADTPKQRRDFVNRQAAKSRLASFQVGEERIIGPTQDFIPFSPGVRASKAASPVARIVTLPDQDHLPQGIATGFLLSESLLLTNHHVFPLGIDCRGHGANFNHCFDESGINDGSYFELDPDLFYFSDEELDFALVGVKPKGLKGESLTTFGQVRLIEATGKILTGMSVNIIQHPGGGARQYAITNNRLVDILEEGFLHYETDTEKGSSGSPVFNGDWELIALHHSGVPKMENGKIQDEQDQNWDPDTETEEDIQWVANEGTRVSSMVKALRNAKVSSLREQELLNELLSATSDPVMEAAALVDSSAAMSGNVAGTGTAQNIFNVSGNVTIHVYGRAALPTGLPASEKQIQMQAPPEAALVQEKVLVFDTDYGARKGYDPDFLGVHIPLPKVAPARREELYLVSDYKEYESEERNVPSTPLDGVQDSDPLELRYHHYSLVMNKLYRMCMWTASNCDYTDEMRADGRSRAELGGENWRLDRRVPGRYQLTNSEIYEPAGNFDRGHIHRREDNCWGMRGLETEYSNSDTYHWTNCTPQHELFNQENPKGEEYKGLKGVWGYFESDLEKQIEKAGGQAVLFAGPILNKKIPSKVFQHDGAPIHYPLKFWKVVVVPESTARQPKLLAYGFVFDQSKAIDKFGLDIKELLVLPHFDRQRKSLHDISKLSGVLFPANVIEADQHKEMN